MIKMKARSMFQSLLVCTMAFVLTCCTVTVGPSRVPTGTRFYPASSTVPDSIPAASRNTKQLQEFEGEWRFHQAYYKTQSEAHPTEAPPKFCVSFSGGGIRSAAFGLGVMKGLADSGAIDSVDIYSATSGGSYGMSWYYMEQFAKGEKIDDTILFDTSLENLQSLYRKAGFLPKWQNFLAGFGDILLTPVNLLANGIFGMHLNTSWPGFWYDYTIKQTFHSGKSAKLTELREFIKSQKLPYFIITTTARIDEDQRHNDALSAKTVFEITPLRWGSDAFMFRPIDPDFDIETAIAIAGSAPDSTQAILGASQRVVASALNLDEGRFIGNINHDTDWTTYASYLAPFPLYLGLSQYTRDAFGRNIYLSDGGHQENMAAFPLVRRLCDNIVIVDGEYDPDYVFDGYFRFKHQVEREMGARMMLHSTPDQDVESLDGSPSESFVPPSRDSTPPYPKPFNAKYPVMGGEIGPFPILVGDQLQYKTLKFAYVKLSLDTTPFEKWDSLNPAEQAKLNGEYGENLIRFYNEVRNDRCEESEWFVPCKFPQLDTFHQSFSAVRFAAYVELGASIIKHHFKYNNSALVVDGVDLGRQ